MYQLRSCASPGSHTPSRPLLVVFSVALPSFSAVLAFPVTPISPVVAVPVATVMTVTLSLVALTVIVATATAGVERREAIGPALDHLAQLGDGPVRSL
jgi:hypothetical protein